MFIAMHGPSRQCNVFREDRDVKVYSNRLFFQLVVDALRRRGLTVALCRQQRKLFAWIHDRTDTTVFWPDDESSPAWKAYNSRDACARLVMEKV